MTYGMPWDKTLRPPWEKLPITFALGGKYIHLYASMQNTDTHTHSYRFPLAVHPYTTCRIPFKKGGKKSCMQLWIFLLFMTSPRGSTLPLHIPFLLLLKKKFSTFLCLLYHFYARNSRDVLFIYLFRLDKKIIKISAQKSEENAFFWGMN